MPKTANAKPARVMTRVASGCTGVREKSCQYQSAKAPRAMLAVKATRSMTVVTCRHRGRAPCWLRRAHSHQAQPQLRGGTPKTAKSTAHSVQFIVLQQNLAHRPKENGPGIYRSHSVEPCFEVRSGVSRRPRLRQLLRWPSDRCHSNGRCRSPERSISACHHSRSRPERLWRYR